MDITELADRVAADVYNAVSADLSADEKTKISDIVVQSLRDATRVTHTEYKDVARVCCGPEADLAHKIQDQMDKKRQMLVTNLMSMR